MARTINFNAGPAALPLGALERAQKELLDIGGTGMSVMEHSHRGKAYEAVHNEAIALTKELLAVPDNYDILLLQGGASPAPVAANAKAAAREMPQYRDGGALMTSISAPGRKRGSPLRRRAACWPGLRRRC